MNMINVKLEIEKDTILKACLSAFNQIPNKKLNNNYFYSTYAIAAKIDDLFRKIEEENK